MTWVLSLTAGVAFGGVVVAILAAAKRGDQMIDLMVSRGALAPNGLVSTENQPPVAPPGKLTRGFNSSKIP